MVGLGRLHRQKLRLAVGWFTSHWKVAYHLFKKGLRDSPDCRWFYVEEETTEHLLWHGPVWTRLRHSLLSSPELQPEDLRQVEFKAVLQFIAKANMGLE